MFFLNEMYKIEKILHSYRSSGITDVDELVKLRDLNKLSDAGKRYYYSAAIIPYSEMLEYIDEYNNSSMEESTELHWWDELTDKYDKIDGRPIMFTVNDTISRFSEVKSLSKSLIYGRKMKQLFASDSFEKKLIKKQRLDLPKCINHNGAYYIRPDNVIEINDSMIDGKSTIR